MPWYLWALVFLMFGTSIIVNGAGALSVATTATKIDTLSIGAIWERFGTFDVLTQVALLLVVLAALIIPLGTVAAGEGLAALFFDREVAADDLDKHWSEVEYHELRKAYFAAYTKAGMRPGDAKRQASVIAGGLIERGIAPVPPFVPTGQDTRAAPGGTEDHQTRAGAVSPCGESRPGPPVPAGA